jgi:hypothetical protein
MRLMSLAALLALCACASGSTKNNDAGLEGPLRQQRVEMTRVETPNGVIEIDWHEQRTFEETKLLVDVDKAWAAVPAVFGELGIEPNVVDSKQHVFGNAGTTLRRRLGSQHMSRYFDCGSTTGIANADQYDLIVRVITQIIPAEAGLSAVRTQAEASGHATATSGQQVRCGTTGALEDQIAHMIADQAMRATAK